MIAEELKYRIRQSFGHVPTAEQEQAIGIFADFMADRDPHAVMLIRGSAGTGKTTLAAAIVQTMTALKQSIVLLAPTGRAAKVFSLYSGCPAYTIHRRIYRMKTMMGGFELGYNPARSTLFIVDEASMIANGDTSLLDDLISFVYNGNDCRLMLIGDNAQLPPVGETESPALQPSTLRYYGLSVYQCELSEVLRQSQQSGILINATYIRNLSEMMLPKIRLAGFSDIQVVPGNELIEHLASSYSKAGTDDTIVITRSNKRANIYNRGIRSTILDREDELCHGDRLMIVKNNYSLPLPSSNWRGDSASEEASPGGGRMEGASFIANGDMATVQRVRNIHEQHGFRFAEVTLQFPDYDDYELTSTVLLDTLYTEAPALTREQQEQLFSKVMEDYQDIPRKDERMKAVKQDRYFNALQVKFAYAVTCHKAQGGQWSHVYIDQGYMSDDMLTNDYIHWLYTAFTRATDRLFLVNWPSNQLDDNERKHGETME